MSSTLSSEQGSCRAPGCCLVLVVRTGSRGGRSWDASLANLLGSEQGALHAAFLSWGRVRNTKTADEHAWLLCHACPATNLGAAMRVPCPAFPPRLQRTQAHRRHLPRAAAARGGRCGEGPGRAGRCWLLLPGAAGRAAVPFKGASTRPARPGQLAPPAPWLQLLPRHGANKPCTLAAPSCDPALPEMPAVQAASTAAPAQPTPPAATRSRPMEAS